MAFHIEGQDAMRAKLIHVANQPPSDTGRQQVAMEQLAPAGLRYRAVAADQPDVKAKGSRYGHSEGMTAPRAEHNLNPGRVCPTECSEIGLGNLEIGVQQRPIDIKRDESNERLHWIDSTIGLRRNPAAQNRKTIPPVAMMLLCLPEMKGTAKPRPPELKYLISPRRLMNGKTFASSPPPKFTAAEVSLLFTSEPESVPLALKCDTPIPATKNGETGNSGASFSFSPGVTKVAV